MGLTETQRALYGRCWILNRTTVSWITSMFLLFLFSSPWLLTLSFFPQSMDIPVDSHGCYSSPQVRPHSQTERLPWYLIKVNQLITLTPSPSIAWRSSKFQVTSQKKTSGFIKFSHGPSYELLGACMRAKSPKVMSNESYVTFFGKSSPSLVL